MPGPWGRRIIPLTAITAVGNNANTKFNSVATTLGGTGS